MKLSLGLRAAVLTAALAFGLSAAAGSSASSVVASGSGGLAAPHRSNIVLTGLRAGSPTATATATPTATPTPVVVNTWFQASPSGSTVSVNSSGGSQIQSGDLLISGCGVSSGLTVSSAPSGFTCQVPYFSSGYSAELLCSKTATSGDVGATFTYTFSGSPIGGCGVTAIRLSGGLVFDVAGSGSTGTGNTPAAASITLTNSNEVLVWEASNSAGSGTGPAVTVPTGFIQLWNQPAVWYGSYGSTLAIEFGVPNGATGTVSGSISGDNLNWQAVLAGFAP